jgi:WS/DGAT/MGAT family acyltransferase
VTDPHVGAASLSAPRTRALSALDLAFFVLESRERMSNVGPLAILRLPPRARSASALADRLLRAMQRQPVAYPFDLRYRPPGMHGLPRLEAAQAVDVARHCLRHTLPAPGTDAELFDFVCRLHEKRLDRSRPHWELHVIDGLRGNRVALYFKVHHGMLDGRGLVELFRRWFSEDAADKAVRAPWAVLPPPKTRARGEAAGAWDLSKLNARLSDAGKSIMSLYGALGRQALASAGLAQGVPLPFVGTPSALRGAPSVRRSFAYCVLPLARLKAFGQAHEATVNDVLLTVLDIAMTRYLGRRGQDGAPLVADMPVALADAAQGGNAIAILQFRLGAPGASPRERLAQVVARTAELKRHVKRTDPHALITYTAAVHGIPALLEALRVPKAPMLATAVISNPFGLLERRYLGGAELEMALPMSVLAPGQSLNITAATYGEGLQIAFLGLAAELPDIQRLADEAVAAFQTLLAEVPAQRVHSTRSRRSTRTPDPNQPSRKRRTR